MSFAACSQSGKKVRASGLKNMKRAQQGGRREYHPGIPCQQAIGPGMPVTTGTPKMDFAGVDWNLTDN
ncbi:hypothetical protein [Arthrobacter sp. PAMC25564]|uniref:hypothetical protein n=1 Tax=Arthrobacter sp. PAMC25564 TaxID=2565366 RepID=UPI0014465378|nr:hypothetical protein [Arthrobacter sp. PAMC25564]